MLTRFRQSDREGTTDRGNETKRANGGEVNPTVRARDEERRQKRRMRMRKRRKRRRRRRRTRTCVRRRETQNAINCRGNVHTKPPVSTRRLSERSRLPCGFQKFHTLPISSQPRPATSAGSIIVVPLHSAPATRSIISAVYHKPRENYLR